VHQPRATPTCYPSLLFRASEIRSIYNQRGPYDTAAQVTQDRTSLGQSTFDAVAGASVSKRIVSCAIQP
jgi:hypothetical protein